MKRSRLLTLGATLSLLVATAAGGGAYLLHSTPVHASAPDPHQVSIGALSQANVHPKYASVGAKDHGRGGSQHGIPNIDSLANFTGVYHVKGYDSNGALNTTWAYDTVGNAPSRGGTTFINAPIVPVSLNLLDANGNTLYTDSATPFVKPTVSSPVFQRAKYSSSNTPTQFSDAIQRAEYYQQAQENWHTILVPKVKQGRTMSLPYGSYVYALNSDGTCCAYVLANIETFSNLLFPATPTDTTTPVGAAENAGDITTKDMSTFLFPNTYLYFGTDWTAPGACCVLGYHTYDSEPGTASNGNREKRYVVNYSSWMTPGLFTGLGDVTALSHEISETYNDPFVASDNLHNITPWWLAPNGLCQNDLETGDVIEGLSNAIYPITMHGYTYHPQNEALLQWFESRPHSDALNGAFSYPDESVLTSANVSQQLNCAGPA